MRFFKYVRASSLIKIFNSKVGLFILILFITGFRYSQPYLEFVREKNYPISWCIAPFYFASFGFLAIFYFGIVYINSDVPFMQHSNMYQLIRMGRRRWALGQISGIFVRSFLIIVLTALACILPFAGKIEWSNDWGKVIYTLASQGPISEFARNNSLDFTFNYEILGSYTPLQLMFITLFLCTLICTFLGTWMFLISLFAERVFAVSTALMFVLLLFFVHNVHAKMHQILAYFVPAYWAEFALSETPISGFYRMPPITYMFAFLIIAIGVMSVIICVRVKSIEFNWENEDI